MKHSRRSPNAFTRNEGSCSGVAVLPAYVPGEDHGEYVSAYPEVWEVQP